jgi:hypothetical protein
MGRNTTSSRRRQGDEIDFTGLIEPVARALLGEPNDDLSNDTELRYGNFGSLSIDLEKNAWRDFELNEGGGVLELIKRETGNDNTADAIQWLVDHRLIKELEDDDEEEKPNKPPPGKKRSGRMEVVAQYDYPNAHNVVLYQKQRFHFRLPDGTFALSHKGKPNKTFSLRRPDPDRPGAWINDIEGVKTIPYRLPELPRGIAASQLIFIPEGEGKVDLLKRWHLIATCSPFGGGSNGKDRKNWPDHFADYFVGADIVLLGDNDEVGREHVATVGAALAGVATRIRVLELPGLDEKGDIEDWVEAGGTREALLELVEKAAEPWKPSKNKKSKALVDLEAFYAHSPTNTYLFRPTHDLWPAVSVNARVPPVPMVNKHGAPILNEKGEQKYESATSWLNRNRVVERITWVPGAPELIPNRYLIADGWVDEVGAASFNRYRAPTIVHGDPEKVGPWTDLVRLMYGEEDAEHILNFLAQRVQQPQIKINHALVLGGAPGIGKDSMLAPVKAAVGPWNFAEVSPKQVLGRFNPFIQSTIMRISEARDLGEVDRFTFYEHLKTISAEPPESLLVDDKNLRAYSVLNCTGVIITTNYLLDGIYLTPEDRRNYVAWSERVQEQYHIDYWRTLHRWYQTEGGIQNVAAFLATRDLSGFDPKAPPKKTSAFWQIVNANRAPEDSELLDILDRLGNPEATTLLRVADLADADFGKWLRDRKNARAVNHRFDKCGYVAVPNEDANDDRNKMWRIDGRRQAIYAKKSLTFPERVIAARALSRRRYSS